MTGPRVFVARKIPDKPLRLVLDSCDATVWPGETPPSPEELAEGVRGVEGVLSLLTDRMDGPLMDEAGPQLTVISNFAVGLDNVDLDAATERGIRVGHTPGVLTETTADCALALMLAAARRLAEGMAYVRAGRWKTWGPELLLGQDLHGATLGIVGLGAIGRAVARRAKGFDMTVLFVDPSAGPEVEAELGASRAESLEALLAESDFVSLHCPLTKETHHLVDSAALRTMKRTAILVNTARGPIVDTEALVTALEAGEIGAAALDVTDPEPLPATHPLVSMPSCIVVPHVGSASHATRERMGMMAAENLLAGLRGEPLPNLANPAVLGR